MPDDFLTRLRAAKTADERDWIVTEDLLNTLSPDLRSLTWAAAIPHWFDADILAALRPELKDRATQLYADLQTLPFVEVFPERGHNIHELTRRLMLDHLWRDNPDEFRALSARAAEFFAGTDEISRQVESIYHLIVAEPEKGADAVWSFGAVLNDAFRFAELESFVATLFEQVNANRAIGRTRALALFFKGLSDQKAYRMADSLNAFERALADVGQDQQLHANVLQAMGDVQQFRADRDTALASYAQALELFRAVGDRLGEANVLQAMGDVQQFRKEMNTALASYAQALELFRAVGDRLGEANVLKAMGDVQQFRADRDTALASYAQALELFRAVGSKLGEANVLKAMGDVQQFRADRDTALASYAQALELFRAVGDRLGEANVLQAMGDVQQFRKEMNTALASYAQALELFRAVGSKLGEANVHLALGDERVSQKDFEKAIEFYGVAQCLYEETDAKYNQSLNLVRIADVYSKQKSYEQAITHLRRATDISPWWANAWNSLGNTLESLKRYEEAIAAFSHAIELEPNSAYLYRNRASQFLELVRLDEAEKDIARAVELQPDNVYTHGRQGYLALARGQLADALTHIQYAAEHDDDVGWQLGLALAQFANGNAAEAQKIITAALEKTDADQRENAREWLARIVKLRPELAVDAGRIEEMLK